MHIENGQKKLIWTDVCFLDDGQTWHEVKKSDTISDLYLCNDEVNPLHLRLKTHIPFLWNYGGSV